MARYSQLFSIEVRHSFFTSGLCRELEFVPTPRTAGKIRNAGLLHKATRAGVRVFSDLERLDSLQLHAADDQDPLELVFKAYSLDPLFMNYTEGGRAQDDTVRFFGSSTAVAQNDGSLRLHAGEYTGAEDFKPMDFPGFQDVLTPKDRMAKPTFVVSISVPEGVADALIDGSYEGPRAYFVNFQERKTFWKYFLVGDLAREDIYVADLDNSTKFVLGGNEVLADERTAITFESTTALPLRERSEYRFQLRERGSGDGKVLIRRLPTASAAQLGEEQTEGQDTLVSEMYVNS